MGGALMLAHSSFFFSNNNFGFKAKLTENRAKLAG